MKRDAICVHTLTQLPYPSSALITTLPSLVLTLLLLLRSPTSTPASIFPAIASLNALRLPLLFLPGAVNGVFVEGVVSGGKYNEVCEGLIERGGGGTVHTALHTGADLVISNVTTGLFKEGVSGVVRGRGVTRVVGGSGSGKSHFLSLLCGMEGTRAVTGATSVTGVVGPKCHRVNQGKWLPDCRSVRECVTLGARYDPRVYERVVEAVCLTGKEAPLSVSSPSGGQRTRLAIGRAVYSACVEGGVVVVDDVLGSLDEGTRRRVWGGVKRLMREEGFGVVVVGEEGERTVVVGGGKVEFREGRGEGGEGEVVGKREEVAAVTEVTSLDVPEENPLPHPQGAKVVAGSTEAQVTPAALPLRSYFAYFLRTKSPTLIAMTLVSYFASSFFSVGQQATIAALDSPGFSRRLIGVTGAIAVSQFVRTLFTVVIGLMASRDLFSNMLRTLEVSEAPHMCEQRKGSGTREGTDALRGTRCEGRDVRNALRGETCAGSAARSALRGTRCEERAAKPPSPSYPQTAFFAPL